MRPPDRTTGTKVKETPNDLKRTVGVQDVIEVQLLPVTTGNSPPARKRASSPEMAVKFGSASVRISPARSRRIPFELDDQSMDFASRLPPRCHSPIAFMKVVSG
jgi:hypothetical protein